MTILPIVERELRVASRRSSTYMTRSLVALAGILVGLVVLLVNLGAPQSMVGKFIFGGLAVLSMVHCLLAGRISTADCISEEKREGTLGLLFLTDLKGYDVVFGKLAATSLNGFYGLLAIFPVLALPLLLGGVSSGQFWRVALLLVVSFMFSLSVGIFSSSIARDSRNAMGINFGLLFLFVLLLPGVTALIAANSSSHPFYRELLFASPLYDLFLCLFASSMPPGVAPPANDFWISLAVIHGLTWFMLIFAAITVPKSWQDRPAGPTRSLKARLFELWHRWSYGNPAGRPAFRRRLLDANAFYWLAARARLKPLHVWTAYGFVGAWWVWGRVSSGPTWLNEEINITMALMINAVLKLWIILEAGQRLAEAQRAGALELILSTPLTVRDIVRGQFMALRRQFLAPLVFALLLEFFLMRQSLHGQNLAAMSMWLASLFFLPMDILALAWVSMAQSLTAKNFNRAVISTVFFVLVLPWLAFGAVALVTALWCELTTSGAELPNSNYYLGWWCALGLAADVVFALLARRKLLGKMREIAMRRFASQATQAGWFRRSKTVANTKQQAIVPNPSQPIEAANVAPAIARPPKLKKIKIPRYAMVCVLLLACIAFFVAYSLANSKRHYPPPVPVPVSLAKGQPRIIPANNGAYLLLADGSFWRWGKPDYTFPPTDLPECIGTNSDWKEVDPTYFGFLGLKNDGTLWQRDSRGAKGGLRQIGAEHDWVTACSSGDQCVALKSNGTIWGWGKIWRSASNRLVEQTNLVQLNDDSDWMAIQSQGLGNLAVKRDGTLWTWGQVWIRGGNAFSTRAFPDPTQVCSDTNWTGFESNWQPLVRNASGELWIPFWGVPNPEAVAASNSRLLITNAVPNRFAIAFCGKMVHYELRPDGTLWQRAIEYPTGNVATGDPPEKWQQVGKRKDWITLCGGSGIAYGLTSDGTLWTWGVDPTANPTPTFATKLQMLKLNLRNWLNRGSLPGGAVSSINMPQFEKEPRALMKFQDDKKNP